MPADPRLFKAARVLIDISQGTLADNAGVSLGVVTRLEAGEGVRAESWLKVHNALVKEGVIFIEPSGGQGPGVRLAKPFEEKIFAKD